MLSESVARVWHRQGVQPPKRLGAAKANANAAFGESNKVANSRLAGGETPNEDWGAIGGQSPGDSPLERAWYG